jgi:transposase
MSKLLVSDALWTLVAPLLPPEQTKPTGGRLRIAGRAELIGILFVLKSCMPWELPPKS